MSESSFSSYLFPDLLGLNELKDQIRQKYPNIRNLNRMTQDEAVRVFRNMLTPLPQRDYSISSRRGKLLRQRRKLAGLEDKSSSNLSTTSTPDFPSSKRPSIGSRLKPPPTVTSSTKIQLTALSVDTSQKRNTAVLESTTINSPTKTRKSEKNSENVTNKRSEPPSDQNKTEPTTATKPKRIKITWP